MLIWIMKRAAPVLVLTGCTAENADNQAVGANKSEVAVADTSPAPPMDEGPGSEAPAPSAPATPIPPGEPGGLPDDRTPVSEAPFTLESAQGAANVVQRYYALLESGRYAQAYALWERRGVGMTRQAFAASFDRYSEYHAQVGAPGRIDAGAGQRYVTVPVQVYGKLKQGGRPFNMRGDVILHRVEMDGAGPKERKWRIRSTDIKPRPGEATPDPAPPGSENNRSTARYRCMDGSRLAITYDNDNARVILVRAGQRTVLPAERVASGIAYTNGKIRWSGKGESFTFAAPGQPPMPCAVMGR